MKKTLLTLLAAITLNIGYVTAADTEIHEPKLAKILASQIYSMLGENVIPSEIRGSKAEVRVAVDTGNYLRVLSIETDNEALETYIKSNINFQKITKGTYKQGIVYRIPIEVKK